MAPRISNSSAPPPYHTLPPRVASQNEEDLNEIEARWDQECRCGSTCRFACINGYNIVFGFEPKIQQTMSIKRLFRNRKAHPPWRALMILKMRNIPRLMRRGFFWSPENLVNGHQRINLYEHRLRHLLLRKFASQWGWALREGSWPHRRSYHVKDLGPNPEWNGTLTVFGKEPSTVINFDIDSIKIDTTVWAFAVDRDNLIVYDTRRGLDEAFNTVCPGLSLKGWWPWPKAPEEKEEYEKAKK